MFGVDFETHEHDEETDSLPNSHDFVRVHRIHRSERTRIARGLSLFSIFGVPRFRVYGSIDRIRAALADNVNRSRHGTTENNFRF